MKETAISNVKLKKIKVMKNLKSKAMKVAWTIFRKGEATMKNWSKALKKAWSWVKEQAENTKEFYFDTIVKRTDKATLFKKERRFSDALVWVPNSLIKHITTENYVVVDAWFANKLVSEGKLEWLDVK